MKTIFLLIPLLAGLALPALAEDSGPIQITDAKARPTAPGLTTGVVYMTVANRGDSDDTLTGLSTPIAEKAETHRTTDTGGVAKMDAVANLPVKAKGTVTFSPNGLHVMLMGLKQPLKLGDSFPLTLNFAKAGDVAVTVKVEPIKMPGKAMPDMPGMKM